MKKTASTKVGLTDAGRAVLTGLGSGALASSLGKDKDKTRNFAVGAAAAAPIGYLSNRGLVKLMLKRGREVQKRDFARGDSIMDFKKSFYKKEQDIGEKFSAKMKDLHGEEFHKRFDEYELLGKKRMAAFKKEVERLEASKKQQYDRDMSRLGQMGMVGDNIQNLAGPAMGAVGLYRHHKKRKQMKKTASFNPYIAALGGYGLGRGLGKTEKQKQNRGLAYAGTMGALGFGIDAIGEKELQDKEFIIRKRRDITEKPKFESRLSHIKDVYNTKRKKKAASLDKAIEKALDRYRDELRSGPAAQAGKLSKKEFKEFMSLKRNTLRAKRDAHLSAIDVQKFNALKEAREAFNGFNAKTTPEYLQAATRINRIRKGFPMLALAGGLGATAIDHLRARKKLRRRR